MLATTNSGACPCGNPAYEGCCAPFHNGSQVAPTAEALMRSRYSAYVLELGDYLLATWHPQYRPKLSATELTAEGPKWLSLRVLSTAEHPSTRQAEVEFVAQYQAVGEKSAQFHERSYFQRYKGAWCYTQGDIISDA